MDGDDFFFGYHYFWKHPFSWMCSLFLFGFYFLFGLGEVERMGRKERLHSLTMLIQWIIDYEMEKMKVATSTSIAFIVGNSKYTVV